MYNKGYNNYGGCIMKTKVLFLVFLVFLLNANLVFGLIIIEDGFFGALTLHGHEELLMTGGGG
jgi:hypothetical protein